MKRFHPSPRLVLFNLLVILILAMSGLASAQDAETGDCVRIANVEASGELLNLDPINQPSTENSIMVGAVYNRLMDLDSNFEVHPELAESWESNEDATEWTFNLREGVQWHDGTPFTAEDVAYTYKRLVDPQEPELGSEAASTLAFLTPEGIEAVDDLTVVFRTEQPVVELPVLITSKNTYIIKNGTTHDDILAGAIGTGPFMPVDFDPAAQPHVFVKNPNYWEEGLPAADCLEFYAIQEATTRNAALLSGEVDLVQQVDYATLPTVQNNEDIQLMTTGPATSVVLAMWVDTPPFDDNRVRRALKMLIDRQAMVDTALLGYGFIGDDNPVPPVSPWAWRSEVPPRDVEGAIALLAEAGYGPDNPLRIDLYSSEYIPGATAVAQLFVEQAAEAGVEVNLIIGSPADHWDTVWLNESFVGSGWNARHPGEGLGIAFRSNSQYPETHWFREDFDALLDQANTEPDPEARAELYRQAEQMITEEGGSITPVFQQIVAAMRSECTGYEPHVQLYRMDFRYVSCERG